MCMNTKGNVARALLATTILAGVAIGAPAFAQTPPTSAAAQPAPPSTSSDASGEVSAVVVTGSRLRNKEFSSLAPLQVITSEEATLRGFADTAAILQSATVAGNGTQINNNFTGFVVNGGPGVNTVALRGLGTDRTLVLLNGKRLGPAGTQGAVSSVDLNTLPSTIIDHIEIIKDGSSSIYGSDAVAGIINIITKQNLNGGDLHAYSKFTGDGGGLTTDVAGDWGKTFSHGYITASVDVYSQEALHYRDRNYLNCTQDFAYDQTTGARLDLTNQTTGAVKCQNILGGLAISDNTGYRYTVTPGTAGNGIPNSPARYAGLTRVNCTIYSNGLCARTAPTDTINVAATRVSRALQPTEDNPGYLDSDAVSPVRRYTGTLSGAYDIVPNYVTAYGDFLFNRRVSTQLGYRQVFPDVEATNPTNPLLSIRNESEPVVLTPFGTAQKVDYYRGVGGFRGALPDFGTFKNWRYDLSLQFSQSTGDYSTDIIRADRLSAVIAPNGCDTTYAGPYIGGPFDANGNQLSMSQYEPGKACQPVNFTRATQNDRFTDSEKAFLGGYDTGHTNYEQSYIEGDFNGDIFPLPAGAASADVGFHVRRDRINDVPGPETLAGNSWGLSTAGITRGAQNVYEVFGEVGIPILRDVPFAYRVNMDISGRYSHYTTVGDAKTYKAAIRWDVAPWLGFKYDQGTSFRGPALYELFLANQSGFIGQLGLDPCIDYTASGNANVQKNCAAAGVPAGYLGNNPTAQVFSGGGGSNLQPETSFARTVGIIFQPRWFGLNINAEVDYYENKIHNTITQFGAGNIVNQCYSRNDYPNAYCNLFTRDLNPASPTYLGITTVQNNYLNVGTVIDRGIDLNIRSTFKLPYEVKLTFNSQHSWTLRSTTELLPGTIQDYNGTIGNPRYVGNFDFRFDWRTWTVDWFVATVGPTSDSKFGPNTAASYRGTGVPYQFLDKTGFYAISNLSVRKQFRNGITAEAGVQNLFDLKPPSYSDLGYESLIGQTPLTSQYDLYGRSIFLQLDKKF